MLDSFIEHLYQKGWLNITSIAMDERSLDTLEYAVALVKSKKAQDGRGLSITTSINYAADDPRGILDKIDNVSVDLAHISDADESFAAFTAQRRAKGLNTTIYACTGDYPNSFTRSLPAESAWLMYYTKKYNADGFLRWAFDAWVEDPLVSTDHWYWESGDAFQIYPAAAGTKTPQSSLRFELLKQGVRDVEKLNVIARMNGAFSTRLEELLSGLTKPESLTNEGGAREGTAAGNAQVLADLARLRAGVIALSRSAIELTS